MGNIDPLDTSVDKSVTQERNSDFSCIEKVGVKSLPNKIFADLDPSIRVNLANSVLSKSPKFKNLGLLTFDAMGINNINFTPSARVKSLNSTRRDKFRDGRLGYTHDFERMSETTAYSNHIKNSELETREFFERETENIPLTRQPDLVTTLHKNPLSRTTDSSKNKERRQKELNQDPEQSLSESFSETSSSDSRPKKKKLNKKKKRCKHRKDY